MKKRLTKTELSDYIKRLDTRAVKLTDTQIDDIILASFGELATFKFPFSGQMSLDLTPYIEAGEDTLTVDIEEDVVSIFDLHVTLDTTSDEYTKIHGVSVLTENKLYDDSNEILYPDGFAVGRFHIRLDKLPIGARNVVVEYYYNPNEQFTDLFVDTHTHLAIQYAVGVSLYDYLHDVERAMQKRAALTRVVSSNLTDVPRAFNSTRPSIFPKGV